MTLTEAPMQRSAPTIDPRLRQRWVDARRQEGRRRLRALTALGAVVVVVAAGLGALHSPLVKVRHLRVAIGHVSNGAVSNGPVSNDTLAAGGDLTSAEVVAQAGLSGQRLMVDINTTREAALIDQLPWAANARVLRQWPGTVRITVEVRTPVAEVALTPAAPAGKDGSVQVNPAPAGGVALVDATGRVLARSATAPSGLPVVGSLATPGAPGSWIAGTPGAAAAGSGRAQPGATEVLAVSAALPPSLAAKIWTVEMGSEGLQLIIGRTTVIFGDTTELADKVAALAILVTQVSLSGIKTADLRVPDRPALTPST